MCYIQLMLLFSHCISYLMYVLYWNTRKTIPYIIGTSISKADYIPKGKIPYFPRIERSHHPLLSLEDWFPLLSKCCQCFDPVFGWYDLCVASFFKTETRSEVNLRALVNRHLSHG